jgi:anti-anti-sigma factor
MEVDVSLAIDVTWKPAGVAEISPRGEIDVDNAYEVRDAIVELLTRARPSRVELDLRAVDLIDSAGISALVAGFQMAEISGVKLVVTRPSRFVHRQLWVTGLHGLFGAPKPYQPDVSGHAARVGAPVPVRANRAVGRATR